MSERETFGARTPRAHGQLVDDEMAQALIENRDRLQAIAERTRQDEQAAIKSVERAEENRDAAIEARREAWKNLRSANAALNSLGVPSDVPGRHHPTTEDGERFHEVLRAKKEAPDA